MAGAPDRIVIIGAGQAGGADGVFACGWPALSGAITLIGDEPAPPYQRPPLSKAYLKGELEAERLFLRPIEYYAEHGVELVDRQRGEGDRPLPAKRVELEGGRRSAVRRAGHRHRRAAAEAAAVPGADLSRRARTAARSPMSTGSSAVAVAGRDWSWSARAISGSKWPPSARQLGAQGDRARSRCRRFCRASPAPKIGAFFLTIHRAPELTSGSARSSKASRARTMSPAFASRTVRSSPADLVAGRHRHRCPNLELALDAGLVCGNGIVVDAQCRTSHPDIFAAGDCRLAPDGPLRHARAGWSASTTRSRAARSSQPPCSARRRRPLEAPWFWSDQFDLKLQIAGLWTGADQQILRGDPAVRAFAVFYLKEGRVIAVDAVNSAPEYLVGKMLIAAEATVAPGELADKSVSMKDIGARALG